MKNDSSVQIGSLLLQEVMRLRRILSPAPTGHPLSKRGLDMKRFAHFYAPSARPITRRFAPPSSRRGLERCRLRRRLLFYASNAGGLAHVRSSAASNQTAKIPDQVRNDDIILAPHYVLGSPFRGAEISVALRAFFMPAKAAYNRNHREAIPIKSLTVSRLTVSRSRSRCRTTAMSHYGYFTTMSFIP